MLIFFSPLYDPGNKTGHHISSFVDNSKSLDVRVMILDNKKEMHRFFRHMQI